MRSLFVVTVVLLGVGALQAEPVGGKKVEVKGPHLCCKQCVNIVAGMLKKVDGVTDAACDTNNKTITFTAKDDEVANKAIKTLTDGGFFGSATVDGKEVKVASAKGSTDKTDKVTVLKVHVCCGMCVTAINGLFKDAKVTFSPKGPQKDVTVEGKDLTEAGVLETLQKAGFNGTFDKK